METNGDIMNGCLSLAGRDRDFLWVISHPKSTPTLKPRVLQRVARRLKEQADALRVNWREIPSADREWWVNWASDDLPRSTVKEALVGSLLFGFTVLNILIHRDDAVEVLSAARRLRETILDLSSIDVWDAALADLDFVNASKEGFDDLAAGRVRVVALEDL